MNKWSLRIGVIVFVLLSVLSDISMYLLTAGNEAPVYKVTLYSILVMGLLGMFSFWKNRKLSDDLEFAHKDLEHEKTKRREAVASVNYELTQLRASSAKEIASLKEQLERAEKLLSIEREASDSLRESNERLNGRITKITDCSVASLRIIGRNTTILRTMDPRKMSDDALKELRTNELEAALLMFKGLERFTWFETETTPASCRDFVFALLEKNELDLTERWARDLVRYAHGAGSDVRER